MPSAENGGKGNFYMANRVTVRISGQTYTLLADEPKEYMNEVAEFVQQTIIDCGGSKDFTSTRAMALALINLADSYKKAKRLAEAALEKCKAFEDERSSLRMQLQRANQAAKRRK